MLNTHRSKNLQATFLDSGIFWIRKTTCKEKTSHARIKCRNVLENIRFILFITVVKNDFETKRDCFYYKTARILYLFSSFKMLQHLLQMIQDLEAFRLHVLCEKRIVNLSLNQVHVCFDLYSFIIFTFHNEMQTCTCSMNCSPPSLVSKFCHPTMFLFSK